MSEAGRPEAPMVVGIDVGGTFTDLVLHDRSAGGLSIVKVPSDRARPDRAVLAALDACGAAPDRLALVVHGTTVATNALLERRIARAAFVTTEGFRDVLELGRTTRLVPRTLYQPYFRRPRPLIDRRDRHETAERTGPDGVAEIPPSQPALEALANRLADDGVEAVAIGFLNSFRNPANEALARDVFARRFEHVTVSTEILNEIREFERFSVCAMNACLMPLMARYARALGAEIARRSSRTAFFTVGSHGGLLSAEAMARLPARTLLSGPAAGVAASMHLASALGLDDLIAFDVGGTSSDVALISRGAFPLKRETIFEGLIIKLPQLDIHTVGAGGGSIASIDAGGELHVGPRSAGAAPGPAAYGLGGRDATLTDANVALGRLGADAAGDRALKLHADLAEDAIRTLGDAAGVAPAQAAEAVVKVAVARMASAVREISAMRGHDARAFPLLAYGGAGPLHAALVAESVGVSTVIVPPTPGAFSALGTLCSALTKDAAETRLGPLDAAAREAALAAAARLSRRLTEEFQAERLDASAARFEHQLDLRYQGQSHELTVAVDLAQPVEALAETFETAFEREYGRRDSARGVELVNLRVIARLPMTPPSFPPVQDGRGRAAGRRDLFIDGAWRAAARWRREDLVQDAPVAGPAIVEELSSTTYVPPGWTCRVGRLGELRLDRT
ncbi:MAG: hydantoinase/oxoprolinase family protein [Pseudomonadota bacterium]